MLTDRHVARQRGSEPNETRRGTDRSDTRRRRVGMGRVLAGAAVAVVAATAIQVAPAPAQTVGRTFYVDCNGSDAANGLSPDAAWKSMAKANAAPLQPGDSLLFKTDCRWTGRALTAKWFGTDTAKIVIGSYGTGARPVIADASGIANVVVSGKYQTIRDLRMEHHITTTVACDQPIATVYGVVFSNGASFNTLRRSYVTGATAGVHLSKTSSDNRVLRNELVENGTLQTWGTNPANDLGAWGVLVRSDRNEVAYNVFRNNSAKCRNQGYRLMSNSVEIYEGSGNRIHHNRSFDDRVFSELGSSATKKASDNVFSYNLFVPNKSESRFITTRGGGDSTYGPVYRTRLTNNTVYATGQDAQGIVCILGCDSTVLSAESNVIVADSKIVYADRTFPFQNNVVWSTTSTPTVQMPTGSVSGLVRADPMFTDPAGGNFSLRAGSPAIDRATAPIIYQQDLDNNPVPFNGVPDVGAFEFVS